MPVKLHIENVKTGVYRQNIGELEFTDRKQENWSLQKESRRTGFNRQKEGENQILQIESRRTRVYRQKVENWSFQIESKRTGVYRQKVEEMEFTDRKKKNWGFLIFMNDCLQF